MDIPTLNQISQSIQVIENFPKQGIIFRNISTLMKNKSLFNKSIEYMYLMIKSMDIKIDYIVGIESRGFLFSQLANLLDCGFVMMRKPGKLPTTKIVSYGKEYGIDSLTIEDNIIEPNSNVLIVDDLIATGGTLYAGIELIQMCRANTIGVIGLIQLEGLGLNSKLVETKIPIMSLLKYKFDSLNIDLDFELNSHLEPYTQTNSNIFVKKYTPLTIKPEYDKKTDTIVFSFPTVETLAENYIANNKGCRKGSIIWDKFPDSQPNIKFEHQSQLEDKRIVFFMTIFDTSNLFAQLSMIKVLPRQFIKSLDIYLCYYSVGTMERVDEEGILATADTLANIISSCMESCKEGKPTIHIYDIHTLQNRFIGFDYNKVQVKLHSGIPLLKKVIDSNSIIVFPDDGAYKRFGKDFNTFKTIVCSKVRNGNNRYITIKDKINFPLSETNIVYNEVIIVDDLVQSGGTLIECKKALEELGYSNISAYTTHVVFPNQGWKKIIANKFKKFYTTNTVPEVVNELKQIPNSPFIILELFGSSKYLCNKIFVSSHNIQKLQAAWNYCSNNISDKEYVVYGVNVNSDIASQPIGDKQTKQGSINRLINMKKYLQINNILYDYLFSYENGIKKFDLNSYCDFCYFTYQQCKYSNQIYCAFTDNDVQIPEKIYNLCLEFEQKKTIGELIQDETGIPKDSFHEFYNKNNMSRVDIMSNIQKMYMFFV
jgi:adenine phosphoribosyltransferase